MAMTANEALTKPTASATPAEAAASRRTSFARFLLWLFLLPAVLFLAVYPCVMIPALGYEHWGASKWGPVLDFGFHADHEDADVLIFGDSSAFLGVDPRQIHAALGLKTVILPNTIGSLPVTEDLALRRYLRGNRPPRLLVLYFSAWNLDYERTAKAHFFEGEEMLLRNGGPTEIAAFARAHALELLAFPMQLNSTLGLRSIRMALRHPDREGEVAAAGGHADYTEPYPPVTSDCQLPEIYLRESASQSVEALLQRYSAPGTEVRVYLAPVPNCANTPELVRGSAGRLGASPPATMPAGDFAQDGFYAHVRPEHVREATALFIRWLRQSPSLYPQGDDRRGTAGYKPMEPVVLIRTQ